jgi:hypothetical protein
MKTTRPLPGPLLVSPADAPPFPVADRLAALAHAPLLAEGNAAGSREKTRAASREENWPEIGPGKRKRRPQPFGQVATFSFINVEPHDCTGPLPSRAEAHVADPARIISCPVCGPAHGLPLCSAWPAPRPSPARLAPPLWGPTRGPPVEMPGRSPLTTLGSTMAAPGQTSRPGQIGSRHPSMWRNLLVMVPRRRPAAPTAATLLLEGRSAPPLAAVRGPSAYALTPAGAARSARQTPAPRSSRRTVDPARPGMRPASTRPRRPWLPRSASARV